MLETQIRPFMDGHNLKSFLPKCSKKKIEFPPYLSCFCLESLIIDLAERFGEFAFYIRGQ